METTLHRQLKALYAGRSHACEVRLAGYRIDAVKRGQLIEIQQSSLSAIRTKVRTLLADHRVLVVKPLFARKVIIRRDPVTQALLSQRTSPHRESLWSLFLEFVHFVDVFPHPNLVLEVVMTEIDEFREDRPSRSRRRRHRPTVVDRQLRELGDRVRLKTNADLRRLLPTTLSDEFTTADLARELELPRWWAQKVAYCLRKTGAIELVGKQGRAALYRKPARRAAAA